MTDLNFLVIFKIILTILLVEGGIVEETSASERLIEFSPVHHQISAVLCIQLHNLKVLSDNLLQISAHPFDLAIGI